MNPGNFCLYSRTERADGIGFAICTPLCIMMHSMKRAVFILENKWRAASSADAVEALGNYRDLGFEADLIYAGTELHSAGPAYDTLFITDSQRLLNQLAGKGAAVCAYRHSANQGEDLSGADYILMEPQWVDRDSLVKIWQRQRGLPWTILKTRRCVVREFVPEDLDAVYGLYDDLACHFLEPPSEDRKKEREILDSYIRRVYRLAGYGNWAVIDRESGGLAGRMGFSFPPGNWAGSAIDAVYGYLVHPGFRRQGIAAEVGRALLDYGFEQLGFETIGADASIFNSISDKILKSFGFVSVAEEENQRYYILNKKDWRNRL